MLMFCFLLSLTAIFKLSSSRKVISGLSESTPSIQFAHKQSTNVEIFQIFYTQPLMQADYILFEVSIAQQDMFIYDRTQDILPFMCFQYNTDPIISNSTSFNTTYSPPCQNGFDFNQYFRANGFYSVKIDLPKQQFSFVAIGVVLSKYKINYKVKIRAQFEDQSGDVCPQDCNWAETIRATCKKGVCQCPDGFIDYDCTQKAMLINEFERQMELNPLADPITYAYYKPSHSSATLDTAEKLKIINIQIQEVGDTQVEMYIHYQGVYPDKTLPTKALNNEMYVLTEKSYSFVLEQKQIFDEDFQPKYVVLGFSLSSSTSSNLTQSNSPNTTILTIQVSESTSEQTNLVMILTYSISSAVGMAIILWIFWTIRKVCIYRKRNHNRTTMELVVVLHLNNTKIVKKKKYRGVTELVEKVMPMIQYSEWINMAQPQHSRRNCNDSCSVCLCEFEREDMCRETICGHCFHKDCLESWMQKQENCPFCRRDLSNQALMDFEKDKDNNNLPFSGSNLSLKIQGQEANKKDMHSSKLQDNNQQKFQQQMIDYKDQHECSPELKKNIQKVMNNQFRAGRNTISSENQHQFTHQSHQRYNSSTICSPTGQECSDRPSSRFLIDSNNDINICSNREIEKGSEDYLLVNKEQLMSERQIFKEDNIETFTSQIKLQLQSQEFQSNEKLKFDDRLTSTIDHPPFSAENIQQQKYSQNDMKRSQLLREKSLKMSGQQKDGISQETKKRG